MLMKITQVKQETPDTKTFRFEAVNQERMLFKPGQFAMVHDIEVTKDGEKKKVNRSYSIASSPTKNYIELVIKAEHPGLTSPKWINEVKEGEQYEVKGPFGKFVYTEDMKGDVVLIGAGSGIAPLRSIVYYILEQKLPTAVYLIYSNKTQEDIIMKDEFLSLEEDHNNFELEFTLTREPEHSDWEGHRGRIDYEFLEDCIGFLEDKLYYLCGPKEFVISMESLLKEHNVPAEKIKKEIYG
ncbi:oxidoreductase [Candidatus Woesearchaeota archaeon]|nr:oxidoreductase [Candidatus Woesearchaeota archaeon]